MKKTILIADDEPNVRLLIKNILHREYTVLEAKDGKEAIDITLSDKPDLILLDIMMPKVDGLSACHAIKNNPVTERIPIVMLTAVGYDLNKKLSMEVMGADDYITKPFDPKALLNVVKGYLHSG